MPLTATVILFVRDNKSVVCFIDHKHIESIFRPNPDLSKATLSRLYQRALKLQEFNYRIMYTPGEMNVWADLLSRWSNQKYYVLVK